MSTSTQSDKLIKLSAQFLTCKLEDTGYDFSKKKLEDMNTVYQKILKSISMMEKAVSTYATESVSLSKSLLQCTQFFNSSPDIVTNIDSASEIFQKTQEEATKYKKFMHDQLFIPVRSYGEQYIKLLDRFKVCDQRRLLVSYHLKRVEDLSKKSLKKQHGLAIAKDKCEIARDDYDFLRNELVDDVNKLCTDTEKVILPIIRVVLEGAHEMLTRTTEIHTTAPELIENLPSTTSFMNYVIHAFGDSMEKVENVRSKRELLDKEEMQKRMQMQQQQQQMSYPQQLPHYQPQQMQYQPQPIQYQYQQQQPIQYQRNPQVVYQQPAQLQQQFTQTPQQFTQIPQQMTYSTQNVSTSYQQQLPQQQLPQQQLPQQKLPQQPPVVSSVNTDEIPKSSTKYYPQQNTSCSVPGVEEFITTDTTQQRNNCKVDYDYTAQGDDELTIQAGEIVTLHEKCGDWWMGEVNGKKGLFPGNYVTLL